MGNIKIMSSAVANQIAAGEVVERPASCVKELIENSLDAGAKTIQVEIMDGGISLITIQDDGCGMDLEDAVLAFSRHATSKLTSERDLFRVRTLGFRGEALASIAAVSKVTLKTRQKESAQGTEVSMTGTDKMDGPRPVGTSVGTRIEIRDLFFNTPARLKYLRTVQTEQSRSVEVVQKAALSSPDVSFECNTSGHILFRTAGRGNVQEVIASLYGVGEARQFIPFQGSTPDYTIHGYVGRPTQSRASRSHGHLFINGRPIRNIGIHQAVVAGYESRLMVNRHPIYVLYIELDPMLVDVNIHPHKLEARFSEERDLCKLVQSTIKKALDEVLMVPSFQFGEKNVKHENHVSEVPLVFENRKTVQEQSYQPRERNVQYSVSPAPPVFKHPTAGISKASMDAVLQQPAHPAPLETTASGSSTFANIEAEKRPENWQLHPIGQALGMYILADDGECLYIIDQHAAHERVLYERFSKRMRGKEIHGIPLLTPIHRTLSPGEHAFLTGNLSLLAQMGLQFEPFGGYDVLLRTVPDIWEGLDSEQLVSEVCACFEGGQLGKDVVDVLRSTIVTRACKAAIKANWYLSQEEMEALCAALSDLDDPFHCPHGRPVFIRMTNRDLEKGFKRIV
jgi:DNA mismatch repair protein MutL